jgi:hypothetical protein
MGKILTSYVTTEKQNLHVNVNCGRKGKKKRRENDTNDLRVVLCYTLKSITEVMR